MKSALTGKGKQHSATLELDYCEESDERIYVDTLSIEPGFWVDSDSIKISIMSKVINNFDGTEKIDEEAEISITPAQAKILIAFLQTI
ncbi:MAG TPA: hypothetical protein PK228_19875 [Saprospiraceae bacterium]|nr:hypothetical protein [Saprospiraceae bacterium]